MATINGSSGDDDIFGTSDGDTVQGGAGNDRIEGRDGNDTIKGGDGDDVIVGYDAVGLTSGDYSSASDDGSDDSIDGGAGNDTIYYGEGRDTVRGGTGADYIADSPDDSGHTGANELYGDAGDDTIFGSGGGDTIFGGADNDELHGGAGNDTVYGGSGDDSIHGDAGDDTLFSGDGQDSIAGDEGADSIDGGAGSDSLDGGAGNDTLDGGLGNDSIDGGIGDDSITGGDGNDTIYGGDSASDVPLERVSFKWSDIPDPSDGGQIDQGDVLNTGSQFVNGVEVDYTLSNSSSTYQSNAVYTNGIDGDGTANSNSAISFNNSVDFDVDFSVVVENVSFRISDFDDANDTFVIRAYDINGIQIAFTATPGSNVNGANNDAVAGNETFGAPSTSSISDTNPNGSLLIEIPGPVARIEMEFNQTESGTLVGSDIYFDDPETGLAVSGDDTIDAGDGDDVIYAGEGDDSIAGGTGTDTYDATQSTDMADENITVVVDGNGDGTSIKDDDGTTDTFTSIERFLAGENADEIDEITLTEAVQVTDVSGMDNSAVGVFTADVNGQSYFFGGVGEPTINDILSGNFDPGGGAIWPQGNYAITSGEENGAQVDQFYFEGFENVNFDVVCFSRGTHIETDHGEILIEDLSAGVLVRTMDHGLQPISWIGSTTVAAVGDHAPIVIAKGALGNTRELRVSPQHRMLLEGWRQELLFGESQTLAPAKFLCNDQTIRQVQGGLVEYFHMMFEAHEIVFAEGAPSESFHPGEVGMGSFTDETRNEILSLFPQLAEDFTTYGPSARTSLKAFEAAVIGSFAST